MVRMKDERLVKRSETKKQGGWTGHMVRMKDERLVKRSETKKQGWTGHMVRRMRKTMARVGGMCGD